MAVTTAATAEPQSDREVLEALYDAAGGPNWTNSANWLTDAPLSEWFGVSTDESGRVTVLYLSGNALTGPIPGELGSLLKLETLELSGNDLTGPVPSWLGNLVQLRYLSLGGNDLTGPIPGELGSLLKLESLQLYENDLTGPVPSWLGNLVQAPIPGSQRERIDRPDPGRTRKPAETRIAESLLERFDGAGAVVVGEPGPAPVAESRR